MFTRYYTHPRTRVFWLTIPVDAGRARYGSSVSITAVPFSPIRDWL